jgi:hypothetical protein
MASCSRCRSGRDRVDADVVDADDGSRGWCRRSQRSRRSDDVNADIAFTDEGAAASVKLKPKEADDDDEVGRCINVDVGM